MSFFSISIMPIICFFTKIVLARILLLLYYKSAFEKAELNKEAITMKKITSITIAIILLLIGLAVGFQVGRSAGFETGSKWALVQADILAREAGVFMPVYLDEGGFRVVIKQPRGLYKRSWQLADEYDRGRSTLKTAELQDLDEQDACRDGQQTEL
jgi:hypothetical protein